jgi:hypothetical protein
MKAQGKINLFTLSVLAGLFWMALAGNSVALNIPACPRAEKLKEELWTVNEVRTLRTYYQSKESAEDIREFYKKRLLARGWQLQFPQEAKLPVIGFYNPKEQRYFYILAFDSPYQGGIAEVTTWEAAQELDFFSWPRQETQEAQQIYQDAAGDDLALVPRYPQAVRKFHLQRDSRAGWQGLTYLTADETSQVLDFYRQRMPTLGWRLVSEMSGAGLQGSQMLVFETDSERCLVNVSSLPEEVKSELPTVIVVAYEPKAGLRSSGER